MVFEYELLSFQRDTVDALKKQEVVIIGSDVGTGKSLISLTYVKEMNFKKVLIICPAPLKFNFSNEITKFFSEKFVVLEGSLEKRKTLFQKYFTEDITYLIVNYEMLNSRNVFLFQNVFDLVIFDEIHRVKNYKSKTYKFANKIQTRYKIGLSGTILTNTPLEIYSIVNLLKPCFFDLKVFLHEYAIMGHKFQGPRRGWVMVPVDWKNLDKLHKIIAPFVIRKTREEVFSQLPKRIEKKYYVELSDYEKKLHDYYKSEMKKAYEMETKDVFSYLSLMQQACNGTRMLSLSESSNVSNITEDKNSKLQMLLDVLEDLQNTKKIIIFSKFKRMVYIIEEELKAKIQNAKVFTVTGDTKNKLEIVNQFNNSTEKSILLASDALNYGFNIPDNDVTINFDNSWTNAKNIQRAGRSERMERQKPHLVITLVAKDTFEETIVKILERKQKYSDKAIDGVSDRELVNELLKN